MAFCPPCDDCFQSAFKCFVMVAPTTPFFESLQQGMPVGTHSWWVQQGGAASAKVVEAHYDESSDAMCAHMWSPIVGPIHQHCFACAFGIKLLLKSLQHVIQLPSVWTECVRTRKRQTHAMRTSPLSMRCSSNRVKLNTKRNYLYWSFLPFEVWIHKYDERGTSHMYITSMACYQPCHKTLITNHHVCCSMFEANRLAPWL